MHAIIDPYFDTRQSRFNLTLAGQIVGPLLLMRIALGTAV